MPRKMGNNETKTKVFKGVRRGVKGVRRGEGDKVTNMNHCYTDGFVTPIE